MSVFGRIAVVGLVFTGSVAAAGYAANNEGFYNAVRGTVTELVNGVDAASEVMSGDAHLAGYGGKTNLDRIESSSVVTHVEVVGGGAKQRIVLLDPDGTEVFTHDPEANTTIIAKDVVIPSITVRDTPSSMAELRVVTAAPAIATPDTLRQALLTGEDEPELFYREDL